MKIVELNDFANKCGYFYNNTLEGTGQSFNNGYNCKHPEQTEKYDGIGCCYCFSCPLAEEAVEEDFEDEKIKNPEGYEWGESEFLLVEEGLK